MIMLPFHTLIIAKTRICTHYPVHRCICPIPILLLPLTPNPRPRPNTKPKYTMLKLNPMLSLSLYMLPNLLALPYKNVSSLMLKLNPMLTLSLYMISWYLNSLIKKIIRAEDTKRLSFPGENEQKHLNLTSQDFRHLLEVQLNTYTPRQGRLEKK